MKTGVEYLVSQQKRSIDLALSYALTPAAKLAQFVARSTFIPDDESVFFRQTRLGADNVPFEITKIRTLAGDLPLPIHPLADLYRRFGIDELTQIDHIRNGDMSIFGSRPITLEDRARLIRAASARPGGKQVVEEFEQTVVPAKPGILSTHAIVSHQGIHVKPLDRLVMSIEDHHNASIEYDLSLLKDFMTAVLRRKLVEGRIDI